MPDRDQHIRFLSLAVELARENVRNGTGGPFAAVVVRNGEVIATGTNRVTSNNDPTAHAEVVAIRAAAGYLGSFQLSECAIYASCEPCPMCLGAIYWARPAAVYFAASSADAAAAGFDDSMIYRELSLPLAERRIPSERIDVPDAGAPFREWTDHPHKTEY